MKLRLMICATAASAALFAADVDSVLFGMTRVTDTNSNTTVIGVPWIGEGGGADTLSNLVCTATLHDNDVIYLYENSTWYGYQLEGGVWKPYSTVSGSSTISEPGSAAVKELTRGTALLVQRSAHANPIYLCGRVDTETVNTTVSGNTPALIANPKADFKDMSTVGSVDDEIRVPLDNGGMTVFKKLSTGWATYAVTGTVTRTINGTERTSKLRGWIPGCTLDPGKGAWYVRGSSEGSTTIQW